MRLINAARRFDKTPCTDAYTGDPLFSAQFSLYDENKRDSEAGERRTLSCAADVTLPARRTIAAAGSKWIIGHGFPDTYKGQVIRVGYIAHEATALAQIQTLGQACRNEAGTAAWAAKAWIKNAGDNSASSVLTPQHDLHFAQGEPVTATSLVTIGSTLHLVRVVRDGPAGTLIALADQLPDLAIDTGSVASDGAWNPLTESNSGTTVAGLRVLRARWQSLYEYRNSVAPKFSADDLQLVIAKAALTAQVGQKVTLSDGLWLIEAVASEGDVWFCRAVRHA
jgi:hypothetical protein